ncbi:DUF3566 domain-containing protein [Tessaracoccus sp. MC1865]|uniref:DUF3566 domain-containing protein n=1 Tax=Tessaracoccus sp. MC1865 TaxID=2760310 RepID=UPI00160078BD|nr:DUF3566 domain-containing protein [Tessaracoccus sp. MC1865]MBB1483018.1 DUF3566 domain-containing protein [Tessaracoccus sp. MC1865]QTO37548.1 DUF3566 domain-containing protein [Tessaracoccus sp. MC1865]
MSDAPRWPGADGRPGLDFSPYRSDKPAEPVTSSQSAPEPDTRAQRPVGAPSEQGKPTDDGKPASVAPRVAERAARAAQEWASMPVTPAFGSAPTARTAPVPPPGAKQPPMQGRPGGPAPLGAPTRGGATVVPPGRRSASEAEDGDPLPLAEVAEPKVEKGAAPVRTTRRPRRTRKARLRLARIDPWSVMKTTFLFAIAFGIMLVVATFVIWSVLAGAGTLEYVNTLLNQLLGDQDTAFDVTQILSVNRVLGFSSIVAAINVVIITALATLFAFLYNLAATVMGGLEVTLAED